MSNKDQGERGQFFPIRNTHVWTLDMLVMLKGLCRAGESGTAIAEKMNIAFGTKLTRNAIRGKIYTLGLAIGKSETQVVSVPKLESGAGTTMSHGDVPSMKKNGAKQETNSVSPAPMSTDTVVHNSILPDLNTEEEPLKSYLERLRWVPESGVWNIADLLEHELQCQEAYNYLPLELRMKVGYPRFCRWPVDNQYCGAPGVTGSKASTRHKPRCEKHLTHGVAGGNSDKIIPLRPIIIRGKSVIIK